MTDLIKKYFYTSYNTKHGDIKLLINELQKIINEPHITISELHYLLGTIMAKLTNEPFIHSRMPQWLLTPNGYGLFFDNCSLDHFSKSQDNNKRNKPVFFSHEYSIHMDRLLELHTKAQKNDYEIIIDGYSNWFPGKCCRIILQPKDHIIGLLRS